MIDRLTIQKKMTEHKKEYFSELSKLFKKTFIAIESGIENISFEINEACGGYSFSINGYNSFIDSGTETIFKSMFLENLSENARWMDSIKDFEIKLNKRIDLIKEHIKMVETEIKRSQISKKGN